LEAFNNIKIPKIGVVAHYLQDKIGDTIDKQITTDMLVLGVEVNEEQFPDLRRRIDKCARILHLEKPPRAFIISDPHLKVYVTNFKNPILVIHSAVIEKSSKEVNGTATLSTLPSLKIV